MQNKKRIIIFGCITVATSILFGSAYFFIYGTSSLRETGVPVANPNNLPVYTATSLAQYNGTNEKLPIYIALDGYVYDATPGKKFYIPGGAYHNIAGKDASSELHIFGGSIIKEKYKVIGVFSNQ